MTFEPETLISRMPDLLSTRVDEDIVILNVKTNNYIALDEIGRRIWELLEKPQRIDELCRQLEREFRGDPAKMRTDVLAFLGELEAELMLNLS